MKEHTHSRTHHPTLARKVRPWATTWLVSSDLELGMSVAIPFEARTATTRTAKVPKRVLRHASPTPTHVPTIPPLLEKCDPGPLHGPFRAILSLTCPWLYHSRPAQPPQGRLRSRDAVYTTQNPTSDGPPPCFGTKNAPPGRHVAQFGRSWAWHAHGYPARRLCDHHIGNRGSKPRQKPNTTQPLPKGV